MDGLAANRSILNDSIGYGAESNPVAHQGIVGNGRQMVTKSPRRRRFAFRLRTLFVLVAVLSVPLGWVGYSLEWIRQREEMLLEDGVTGATKYVSAGEHGIPDDPEAPYGLWLFGERGFQCIVAQRQKADEAARLFPEAIVVAEER